MRLDNPSCLTILRLQNVCPLAPLLKRLSIGFLLAVIPSILTVSFVLAEP